MEFKCQYGILKWENMVSGKQFPEETKNLGTGKVAQHSELSAWETEEAGKRKSEIMDS